MKEDFFSTVVDRDFFVCVCGSGEKKGRKVLFWLPVFSEKGVLSESILSDRLAS